MVLRTGLVALVITASFIFSADSVAAMYWRLDEARGRLPATVNLKRSEGVPTQVSGESLNALIDAYRRVRSAVGVESSLFITDMDGINAFAGPSPKGPIVVVTVGMLSLLGTDRDAWAALIGHELAHLYHAHSAETQGRQALIGLFAGLINARDASRGRSYREPIVNLSAQLVDRKFSRDQEREADSSGLGFIVSAGMNPDGAIRLHRKLLSTGGGGTGLFLETHPSGEERIANLNAQISEKYAWTRTQPTPAQRTTVIAAAPATTSEKPFWEAYGTAGKPASSSSAQQDPRPFWEIYAAANRPSVQSPTMAMQSYADVIKQGRNWHNVCTNDAKARKLEGTAFNEHLFQCIDEQTPDYMRIVTFCATAATEAGVTTGTERTRHIQSCVDGHENKRVPGDYWVRYCAYKASVAGPVGSSARQATGNKCLDQTAASVRRALQECSAQARADGHTGSAAQNHIYGCIRDKVPEV